MPLNGYITIDQELCKGCELCIHFCPQHLIISANKLNAAGYLIAACSEEGECTGCAVCSTVCPEVAIEVYRE